LKVKLGAAGKALGDHPAQHGLSILHFARASSERIVTLLSGGVRSSLFRAKAARAPLVVSELVRALGGQELPDPRPPRKRAL